MHCDVCQSKEATVFLTQIVEGKMQKVNLCEACAREKGVNDPTSFALADLLLGISSGQDTGKNPDVVKCTVCGFTQADFKKTGRLGCSSCYDIFDESLTGMLKNMHKGTSHVGKIPAAYRRTVLLGEKIKSLQDTLEKAVAAEEYEKAADLRDQIRKMEAETGA